MIRGVRYLAEFAAQTPSQAPLIFISSAATVQNSPSELGPFIPEGRLNNFNFCTLGYGQSKLAAHEILEHAAQHWDVRSAVLRVGQIAGPVSHGEFGMWNKTEWFPSLIASSKYLQMLPDSLDLVSPGINYMPVDYCARIVCELSEQVVAASTKNRQRKGLVDYYHVVNPHDASWPSLIGCIQEYFGASLRIVPLASWIEALDRSSMEGDKNRSIDRNPALRLLQWFKDMAHGQLSSGVASRLSTQRATELSQGMRDLRPVSKEWMDLWLRQWKF